MGFRKNWFSGKVVSTEGFSVQPVGSNRLLYEDGDHRLYISADKVGPNSWALYPEDMRRDSDRGRQLHDDKLRDLVIRRIREVVEFLGGSLEI